MIMKYVLVCLMLIFSILPSLPLHASGLTFTDFELTGVVQVISYNEDEDYYFSGTGVLLGFSGNCVVTATHIVADEENDYAVRDHTLMVFQPGTEEEEVYEAAVIVGYSDSDVSYVCISDESYTNDIFRHYFPFNDEAMDTLVVGDDVVGLGFPSTGGDTVTATFGQLTGFDTWIEDRDILKTDLSTSGGISGGAVLNDTKHAVGMVVSYTDNDSGGQTTYALSWDLIKTVDAEATATLLGVYEEAGLYSPECVYSQDGDIYLRDGFEYYDMGCTFLVDPRLESLIESQYEYWCSSEILPGYSRNAANLIANANDFDFSTVDWRTYLNTLCGELDDSTDAYNFYTPDQAPGSRLVKSDELPAVYLLMEDGKRHPFDNESTYFSWYDDFSGVETITSDELSDYQMGRAVNVSPGSLVKVVLDPKVYMISDDYELRWITDEQTAETLFGSDWAKKVQDLPEYLLRNYSTGEDISF